MSSGFVLALFGPTASGKTAVAEALASRFPAELISADSMQVYRGLPILTNQPGTPTRLVGVWSLDHEASVAEYGKHYAVMDTALPVEHATVVTLVGRLTRAGMLVKSGAYHRSSAPKRTYRKINNRFWARDTRRYRLGDWPEFEASDA